MEQEVGLHVVLWDVWAAWTLWARCPHVAQGASPQGLMTPRCAVLDTEQSRRAANLQGKGPRAQRTVQPQNFESVLCLSEFSRHACDAPPSRWMKLVACRAATSGVT